MTIKKHIWDQIKEDFKRSIPTSEFQTWLSMASIKQISAQQAVIEVPNKFIAHWLQDNYADQIQTVFKDMLNTLPEIQFTYSDASDILHTPKEEADKQQDMPRFHGINTLTTFADFVTGDSNRLAYSSALNVAERPASTYNPLYIFSELAAGKTHILNAIGNRVLQNNPSANVLYLSADQFVSDFASFRDRYETERFWERDDGPDFVLLDDIHLLGPHREPQIELLSLCSSFLESARQLVVTAAYPPGKIPNLHPQLRSRLEWGLIAEIHPPGQRTKVKIVKKMAKQDKLVLPDDVAFFLANTTDDMNTLERHVRRLKDALPRRKRPIDISTAESIIKKADPSSFLDVTHIQGITAKYFNISISDLLSDKRGRSFSYPRQVAIYLSKKLTALSFKEIGHAFGNKHHSTVIYAQNRIQKAKRENKRVSRDIDKIQRLLL